MVIAPHSRRTLVEGADFRTGVGHGEGPGDRERLGFRGRGPTAVLTDLAALRIGVGQGLAVVIEA